ncbi:hypothetical protein CFR71_01985 [Novacetimonas pomaceti]|uniref:Uncharacterized protein n=1 Tax=Novacetimonas pomaceti TaxID=2021998 RepID=A0A318QBM3_9PROT|nr:hypothetical protein CFR71_01985 [Novacetimonas pomaceti]
MDRYPFAEAGWRVSAADFSGGDVTRTVAGWHRVYPRRTFVHVVPDAFHQAISGSARSGRRKADGKPAWNHHAISRWGRHFLTWA